MPSPDHSFDAFIRINLSGLSDVRETLLRIPSLIDHVIKDPVTLEGIGTVLYKSAITTIDQGGRPLYKPLAQSTIDRRWQKNQKIAPGKRANRQGIVSNQPLKVTGTLRESLKYTVTGESLTLDSVGYLKYHQWEDGRIKARFPARPVWGVHDEDRAGLAEIIATQLGNAITSLTQP